MATLEDDETRQKSPRAADVMRVRDQQCQKQRARPTADAMKDRAISDSGEQGVAR